MGEAKRRKACQTANLKTPEKPLYHYTFGRRMLGIKLKGLLPVEPQHSRFVWLTESTELDPTSCAAISLKNPFYKGNLAEFEKRAGGVFRITISPDTPNLKHFSEAPEVRYIKAKNNYGADPNQWWIARQVKPVHFTDLAQLTQTGWISRQWEALDLEGMNNLPRLAMFFNPTQKRDFVFNLPTLQANY